MPLWTCLLFPSLPLDTFARAQAPSDAARPFVVGSGGRCPRVVAVDAAAHAAGIRAGQLLSAALAFAPELVLRDRDAAAEARALAQLATWALTFTPTACIAPPDAVLADIGGSERLFGGLPRLAARLAGGARALGYAVRLGIAPTPGAALLLARTGRTQPVTDVRALPAALADVPLARVDMDDATRATLREAGITTFGEAAALPRDGLARRFGAALVDAIDHALGTAPDPRPPFVPPPHFASRLELPAPVHDAEALGFGVQRLVQELSAWLAARGLGVTRLTLTLAHERHVRQRGTPATVVPFALGAPARAPAHVLSVLRERLVRVALPAPVEAITLASDATAPLSGRSRGLLPGDDADAVEVPLLDRLRARLGDDAVVRVATHAEHRPEFAMRDAALGDARGAQAPVPDAPRPVWLLSEPQPLAHLVETQPWVLRDGPERIESGWWDGRDIRRDYFIATTPAGETAWIYRDHRYGQGDGEWFLHGLFA
ncbi:MAG: DNA polymerase Y family protein [Burkholderiales bacterium]